MSDNEVLNESQNVNLDDFIFHILVFKGIMCTGPGGIQEAWQEERTKFCPVIQAPRSRHK